MPSINRYIGLLVGLTIMLESESECDYNSNTQYIMPTNQKIFSVFLSHSHKDAKLVEEIAKLLHAEADIKVWLDEWELPPGTDYSSKIRNEINETDWFAAFISDEEPTGWFKYEIELAHHRSITDESISVAAVLLKGANKKHFECFKTKTYVDLQNGLNEREIHKLKCGIRGVAPGPPLSKPEKDDEFAETKQRIKRQLKELKECFDEGCLSEDFYKKTERKLVDRIFQMVR